MSSHLKSLFAYVYFVSIATSCMEKKVQPPVYSERDTIMKKYFAAVDSLPLFDSTEYYFRILKAYHSSDTVFLNKSYKSISEVVKDSWLLKPWSCIEYSPLSSLNYEEAYRFIYDPAFCDKWAIITIGKSAQRIEFEVKLYLVGRQRDTCSLLSHQRKFLNNDHWDSLQYSLGYADFWGLKETNGRSGVDGSSLTVSGYSKYNDLPFKSHTISRWAAEQSAIGQTFKHVLKLANLSVGCFPND